MARTSRIMMEPSPLSAVQNRNTFHAIATPADLYMAPSAPTPQPPARHARLRVAARRAPAPRRRFPQRESGGRGRGGELEIGDGRRGRSEVDRGPRRVLLRVFA
uniref:Uncharacterized protein n=1 Tax=Arundo donax TaxID=35708 RepID=A0A0A9DV22_ARUDO